MKTSIFTLAAAAIALAGNPSNLAAGPFDYAPRTPGCKDVCTVPKKDCCFSYDFIDVAWQYSDYTPDTLGGMKPVGFPFVDVMKGVNVSFSKAIGCNFYFTGAFYNTDGP